MITCPNCGKQVSEGKFCENCGADISNVSAQPASSQVGGVTFCPHCGTKNDANNRFCQSCGKDMQNIQSDNIANKASSAMGGFLGGIKKSVNKATIDLLAIKSDFSNNAILCKIDKTPAGDEKKIKIEDGEVAFVNVGRGYQPYQTTFTLSDNNIVCAYMRKPTRVALDFNIAIETPILKLEDQDNIKIIANYQGTLICEDINVLFNNIIKIKDATWTANDLSDYCRSKVLEEITNLITTNVKNEGGFNLLEEKNQIDKWTNDIDNIIDNNLNEIGLKCENLTLQNVNKNNEEVCNMLIKNLYK